MSYLRPIFKSFFTIFFVYLLSANANQNKRAYSAESQDSYNDVVAVPVGKYNDESYPDLENVVLDLNTHQQIQYNNENSDNVIHLSDDKIKDDIDLGLRHNKQHASVIRRKNINIRDSITDEAKITLSPNVETGSAYGSWNLKQTTQTYQDLKLEPIQSDNSINEMSDMDANDDIDLGLKQNGLVLDQTTVGSLDDTDIEDDIDLGLRPESSIQNNAPVSGLRIIIGEDDDLVNHLSDKDIANDNDLGLRHNRKHDQTTISFLSDKEVANDIDLGLRHNHKHDQTTLSFPSDKDVANDIDLGLRHHREHDQTTASFLSDKDVANDIDLGLKHHREQYQTTVSFLSDEDISNDVDLGLRHFDGVEDETDKTNDEIKLGLKPALIQSRRAIHNSLNIVNVRNNIDLRLRPGVRHAADTELRNKIRDIRRQRFEAREAGKALKYTIANKTGIDKGQGDRVLAENPLIERKLSRAVRETDDSRNTRIQVDNLDKVDFHIEKDKKLLKPDSKLKVFDNNVGDHLSNSFNEFPNMDICDQYDAKECNISFGDPFFKRLFTKSCDKHAICYGCGVKVGIHREDCDKTFHNNMWKACLAKYRDGKSNTIHSLTDTVIKAVEKLKDDFKDNLEHQFKPVLVSTSDMVKGVHELKLLAKSVQKRVILKWAILLANELVAHKPKEVNNHRRTISFNYNERELLDERNNFHESDTKADADKLVTNFCDESLSVIRQNTMTRDVRLGCAEIDLLVCKFFDYLYYFAVRAFGASSYNKKS